MVILSRHAAKECCIPRNFFDVLESHGGEVGKMVYNSERDSLVNLWVCSNAPAGSAARGNLPERCDPQWFAETFSAGKLSSSKEEVWQNVEAVNLYRYVITLQPFVLSSKIFSMVPDSSLVHIVPLRCWLHCQEKPSGTTSKRCDFLFGPRLTMSSASRRKFHRETL